MLPSSHDREAHLCPEAPWHSPYSHLAWIEDTLMFSRGWAASVGRWGACSWRHCSVQAEMTAAGWLHQWHPNFWCCVLGHIYSLHEMHAVWRSQVGHTCSTHYAKVMDFITILWVFKVKSPLYSSHNPTASYHNYFPVNIYYMRLKSSSLRKD